MRRIPGLVAALAILSLPGAAYAADPYTSDEVRELIRRVETRTDEFRKVVDRWLDRSRLDGSQVEDDINAEVKRFERTTDALRRKSERMARYEEVRNEVRNVVDAGRRIDAMIRGGKWNSEIKSRWRNLRDAINALGAIYKVRRI
jgi:hypothetical protein